MKKKNDVVRFILKCILIPAAAIYIIYGLNRPYKRIVAENYWDIIKFDLLKNDEQMQNIQIGNLGSSHGMYDFNYDRITERGNICFNFANTSQSYDYDYAVLKEYAQYMDENSVLFIPVSYFSFNNEVVNSTEAEAMSVRYYRFLSPENIPNYDPYVDLVTYRFPILSAGEDILKLFPKINTVLAAHAQESEINVEEFAKAAGERYSRHFDNKDEYFMPERAHELYEIIAFCRENDITPVLITTPFSSYYIELVSPEFLQEFRATIDKIANDTDVNYYDYSHDERFYGNLELFSDADHLNDEGAVYFTDILWDEVEELQRFH